MDDVVVSVGKTAFHSFFHNHAEHAILSNKIETLERREDDDHKEIVRKVDGLSNDFYELRGEFRSFNGKLDKLENKVDDKFDKVDDKVNKLDDKIEGRFDKLEGRFDKIEGRFDKIEGRFDKIEKKVDKINFDVWEGTLTALRHYLKEQGKL